MRPLSSTDSSRSTRTAESLDLLGDNLFDSSRTMRRSTRRWGGELAAITPRHVYAPLFAVDRRQRFGGDFERGAVWLPGLLPQSVLRDVFKVRLPSLIAGTRRAIRQRARQGKDAVAREWGERLRAGDIPNRAELARRTGISRARVTQVLGTASEF